MNLHPHCEGNGSVEPIPGGWRLSLPAGEAGKYRLAQLADYESLLRNQFPWRSPFFMRMSSRSSNIDVPGTWGFGLWNDPFSIRTYQGSARRIFPVLPQAAWFFQASLPNWLSIHSDVPGNGFFAGTFRSRNIPTALLLPGVLTLPGFLWLPSARLLRKIAAGFVRQSGKIIDADPTLWHSYVLAWHPNRLEFFVDDKLILQTRHIPRGPLGLVIWIDNQYAAFSPMGRLGYGRLANPQPAWIEIRDLSLDRAVV